MAPSSSLEVELNMTTTRHCLCSCFPAPLSDNPLSLSETEVRTCSASSPQTLSSCLEMAS